MGIVATYGYYDQIHSIVFKYSCDIPPYVSTVAAACMAQPETSVDLVPFATATDNLVCGVVVGLNSEEGGISGIGFTYCNGSVSAFVGQEMDLQDPFETIWTNPIVQVTISAYSGVQRLTFTTKSGDVSPTYGNSYYLSTKYDLAGGLVGAVGTVSQDSGTLYSIEFQSSCPKTGTPTLSPTAPTRRPTKYPTLAPSKRPTKMPTPAPTTRPTMPTPAPTRRPKGKRATRSG